MNGGRAQSFSVATRSNEKKRARHFAGPYQTRSLRDTRGCEIAVAFASASRNQKDRRKRAAPRRLAVRRFKCPNASTGETVPRSRSACRTATSLRVDAVGTLSGDMAEPGESAARPESPVAADASPSWGYALIAAGFVYRLGIALRPIRFLDGLTIPDDTYLSLTIARNIARGLGPLYGADYTNGFQPLWVFVLAPVFAMIPDDPDLVLRIGLVLLAILETAMIVLVCRFVRRRGRSNLAAALVAGCWAFNPCLIKISLGGLETSLSALAACATLVELDRIRDADRDRAASLAGLGVLLGIAFLARVDAVFLIPAIALSLLPRFRRSPGAVRRLARRWGVVGSAAAATVTPWFLYSYSYTGDVYPVSGRAVPLIAIANRGVGPGGLPALRRTLLDEAFQLVVQRHAWLLLLLGVLAALALVVGFRNLRGFGASLGSLAPALSYGILLFLAYPLHILAFWFFERYLFPLAIPLLLAIGLTASFLFRLEKFRRVRAALTRILVAATIASHLTRPETRDLLFSRDETNQGYRNLGLWAAKRFPPGTRLGGSQTGALGFYAPALTVINLDGVVNRKCYDAVVAKRNIDYIVQERVEFVVGWEVNIDFIRYYSTIPADDFLEPLGTVRGFRSWGKNWLLYRVRPSPKGSQT
jgi:hypothetical protein